eukprot:SAG31_NODE_4640_length_3079_cov_1.611409_2_plen_141_part_00
MWLASPVDHCWGKAECEATPPPGGTPCCCWQNRTMPQNLATIETYAAKRDGKVVVVADGMSTAANMSQVPTLAEQELRAVRDRKYYEWCANHERCVAMLVFLWNTVGGREIIFGVSAQPVVLKTLEKIGLEIKQGHVPSF